MSDFAFEIMKMIKFHGIVTPSLYFQLIKDALIKIS